MPIDMRNRLLVGLLSLLVPALAAADDPCLTGASLLGDQRALVALRDATEAACPCASYTGGAELNRGAYRKCARGVLDATIGSAGLRLECRSTAQQDIKGAVCGAVGKVACGRVRAEARTPITCKVRPATRCTDRPGIDSTACTDQTYCSDVIDWTAGTCIDPRTNGPFGVGIRMITFTKQSVVNPATPRPLDTLIWYPAPAGASPIEAGFGAVVDAPLDNSGGPYPILMFSHGSCAFPNQSPFLTALLASYGFIVVAPPHPGNTIFDFPACGSTTNQVASFQERPQDIIFVLDQMLAANQDSGSPFFGTIDPSRIGMSGHSFGGLTTYLVVAADSRFKTAMPMAPAVLGNPVLSVPSLTMLGKIDAVVNDDSIRHAYADALPPKLLIEIDNTGHYAFSNGCFPSPDCDPPVTLTQAEAHAQVLRWALPFLKVYLAGDDGFRPFLTDPAPPGATFSHQP